MNYYNDNGELFMCWEQCQSCDDYICNIHDCHAADCDCPELAEWISRFGFDPYTTPLKTCMERNNAQPLTRRANP